MSRYGVDYYGSAYYGLNNLVNFSAAPFLSRPYNYGTIQLTWASPSGTWDYIRLIRRTAGFPTTVEDGNLIFEDAQVGARTVYIDAGQSPANVPLIGGEIYYYTLFVHDTTSGTWKNAGNAMQTAVKDYGTAELMYSYLPAVLTSQVPYDSSVSQDNNFLYRFLQLFALNLDLYRTQADNIANKQDIARFDGTLIPVFMQQLGLPYEPELGLTQSKILLRNAVHLYQTKGSKLGVSDFIKSYAGYSNTVGVNDNLMLDQNDSSFEQSIGNWVSVSNATLARWSASSTPYIAPYAEPTAQPVFPNLQHGVLRVVSTASATTEIAIDTSTSAKLTGIPVNSKNSYTFSGYTRAGTTGRSVHAELYWYDVNGKFISEGTAGANITNTTSGWSRFYVKAAAPVGAKFCIPHVVIASTAASEAHYFDAFYFENGLPVALITSGQMLNGVGTVTFDPNYLPHSFSVGDSIYIQGDGVTTPTGVSLEFCSPNTYTVTSATLTGISFVCPTAPLSYTIPLQTLSHIEAIYATDTSPSNFQDARQLEITLNANRINELLNPNFEGNTNNWAVTNGHLELNTDSSEAAEHESTIGVSGGFAEIYSAASGLVTLVSSAVNVYTSTDYTFSIYIRGESTNYSVTPYISWYDHLNTLISTSTGTAVTTSSTTWLRPSLTATSPSTAAYARVGVKWTATAANNEFMVDAALFEKSSFVGNYFDGSNGVADPADVFWEGTANASRSHYYKNRLATENRLISTLPDYLTLGTTFEFLYAQPYS